MLKRTMALGLALSLTLVAGIALAQTPACSIGVYADPAGTVGLFQPTEVQAFDVYVVAFTEDVINAAAYSIEFPDLFDPGNNPSGTFFVSGTAYGPSGSGISLPPTLPGDTNETIGLGECAVGIGGLPILVARYSCIVTRDNPGGQICLGQHDTLYTELGKAQVNNCTQILKACDIGPCLTVEPPIATESVSFGAVKALYGN
jgi:hypothetical protein